VKKEYWNEYTVKQAMEEVTSDRIKNRVEEDSATANIIERS